MMQIPDLTVKHLGAPTIPSPLTGVKFIPENATVIYAKDVNEVEEELKNTGKISAFEAAGPREKLAPNARLSFQNTNLCTLFSCGKCRHHAGGTTADNKNLHYVTFL